MKKIFALLFLLPTCFVFAKGRVETLGAEYYEIADAYAELKKYDKALYFYEKASADPAYKNASDYNRARMYGLQNDWAKAKKILQTLHESEPANKMILQAYAYTLIMSTSVKDVSEGKNFYKQLAEDNPDDPASLLDYVRILVFTKDYETAQSVVEKAILSFPSAKERANFDELQTQIKNALNKAADKE